MSTSSDEDLADIFQAHADPDRAKSMRAYMKNQFQYYGISSPLRRSLCRDYFQIDQYPTTVELPELVDQLWQYDEREMQYVGADLIRRLVKKQPAAFIDVLENLILRKSWWDTVDALSIDAGTLMLRHPQLQPDTTNRWVNSEHLWLKRAAVIHQLKYKDATDWELLQDYILQVCQSKEFFLRKAAGWALREFSKTNPAQVKSFLGKHRDKLSGLTVREGSKYV
ncbi:MAG: DNA alkylation repair protein [Saprospiraceae bacterium]|nr:DNA alkylation repair protein [Saprospiraceae bacterium]